AHRRRTPAARAGLSEHMSDDDTDSEVASAWVREQAMRLAPDERGDFLVDVVNGRRGRAEGTLPTVLDMIEAARVMRVTCREEHVAELLRGLRELMGGELPPPGEEDAAPDPGWVFAVA